MGQSIDIPSWVACRAARPESSPAQRCARSQRHARHAPKQRGGCDCGAVRYELQIEPGDDDVELSVGGSLIRARDFRLVAGEEFVSGHQFASRDVHYFYCERCGVCSFRRHNVEREGAAFYAVSAACLDW